MDNAGFAVDSIGTIHLLSVFTYMNSLSDIFYSLDLIEAKERQQPFPIANAFFEYLGSVDEVVKKRNLTSRLLQNSDLYGGRENETLDMRYINATFEYIISNIVFSRFGNVHGYLTKILSRDKNITFSSLKEYVSQDLLELEYMNEDGSFSYLSFGAIKGILGTLIMPLFPEPEEEMGLVDLDYIYAQAGLMLARSTMINSTDFTFKEYISMSQTIELTASKNESYELALRIFTLPALLFYAQQENYSFRKQTVAHLMKKQDFWFEAFQDLFLHLRDTFETILWEKLKNSPAYQFALAIENFKNRTSIATKMLEEHCPGIPKSNYESEIKTYKLWASCSFCLEESVWPVPFFGKLFISRKLLPNIDNIYYAQFDEIEPKYLPFAKVSIQKAFEDADLRDVIDSSDTTIFWSGIEPQLWPTDDGTLVDLGPQLQTNMHLFTMRNRNSSSLLAIIDNQNNMTVLKEEDGPENFWNALGLEGREFSIMVASTPFKSSIQSFNDFENNLADVLAKDFRENLHNYGYDKTTGEKVLDFLFSFVPFYHCITNAWAGNGAEAALACMGDIALFIPFGGQFASVGSKLSLNLAQRLGTVTGISARTLTTKLAIQLSMRAGPRELLAGSVAIVQKEFFTKRMFKSLSVGLIRSIDPGLEFLGKSFWKSGSKLVDLFKKVWQNAEKYPSISSKLSSLKKIWNSLRNRLKTIKDEEFVISSTHIRCKRMPPTRPNVINFAGACTSSDVHRDIYPGGENPYGPDLVPVPGGRAELRQTIHPEPKIPVTVSKVSPFGDVSYKQVNQITGQTISPRMRMNHDGFLEPDVPSFSGRIEVPGLVDHVRRDSELKREQNLGQAVEYISQSLKIPEEFVRDIMNHYILAIEPLPTLHSDLSLPQLDRSLHLDIDVENPDDLRRFLELDTDDPVPLEFGINQYTGVGVPTYRDFALDYVKNNGYISDVYGNWYVNNALQLDELVYHPNSIIPSEEELQSASYRILGIHGTMYTQKADYNSFVMGKYFRNAAWKFVSYEDFIVIYNFVINGYDVSELGPNGNRLLKIALIRLALRQGADQSLGFPHTLHSVEEESSLTDFNLRSFHRSREPIIFGRFLLASSTLPYAGSTAKGIAEATPNKRLVSYTTIIESGNSIANINHIIKSEKKYIIMPTAKFRCEYLSERSFHTSHVLYLRMHGVKVKKEIWLRDLVRELETLQEITS